ncbi:MAG: LicD family protein [Lachnospiraceae bacterium]|jgi:phosphorylcholine metabolism protein LicD|nr:LicD family protein [Lachnospiraceae bacterium]
MKKKIKRMNIQEVHNCLFEVLVEVSGILNRNNISFYLIFGTLLGCIREGTSIKWDDDIDICVAEKDWARMNEVLEKELDKESFFIINKKTRRDYPDWRFITRVGLNGTYRKMDYYKDKKNSSGIFIDIFMLVDVPSSKIKTYLWQYELGVIDGVINLISLRQGSFKSPYLLSYFLFRITSNTSSVYQWNKLRYKVQTKYCGKGYKRVTVPFGPFGVYPIKKVNYKKEWFAVRKEHSFSVIDQSGVIVKKGSFPIPSEYKEILRLTYGNWEKRPRNRVMPQLSFWEKNND